MFCCCSVCCQLFWKCCPCSLNSTWKLVDVLGNSCQTVATLWKWFSCALDLNWFVVLWTCVELPLSSFLVLCALYLYLVFQGHWSLLELWFSMSLGIGIHELGSELQGFGNWSLGDSFPKSLGYAKSSATKVRLIT